MAGHADMSGTAGPGLVAVIAYDGLCTFEFGIAVEVFGLPRPEFDFTWYDFRVVSADGSRLRAVGGIFVEAAPDLSILKRARTIVVPGWRNRGERPPDHLLEAISRASEGGARCLSICSGAFVLAAAGLLNGRRATTHWRHVPDFKQMYPDIQVEEDVLYVDEGDVITSAGSAAGIDACVHLVRRDFGSKIANSVARRLILPPHRDGGQAQFIAAPVQERPGRKVSEVLDWARERLDQPLEVRHLANRAAMSERTLLRRFRESLGLAPGEWLQRERMYRARELLESRDGSLNDIAVECGYRSLEAFRAAFKRIVGTSPAAYRKRFHHKA